MKYIKIILSVVVCVLAVSCTTTQKFSVSGRPGTKIYTPDERELGTISESGIVEIELISDAYYPFLLSKDDTSDLMIPFALDYEEHSYSGSEFSKYFGFTLGGLGVAASIGGLIAIITGSTTLGGMLLAGGGLLGGGGTLMGATGESRQNQLDHQYNFRYLSTQTINDNLAFTRPNLTTIPFIVAKPDTTPEQIEEPVREQKSVKEETSSKSTKSFGSKSTKSFKDFGLLLSGTYEGDGVLKLNKKSIESYKNIKVELRRVDNTQVAVQVVEANGVEFFGQSSIYTIKKNRDGSYVLTHNSISVATITIDANSNMLYMHPRVNIDGELYMLEIKARKK